MRRALFLLLILFVYKGSIAQTNYKTQSILASGKWIKVAVSGEGICMLSYNQLSHWGISAPENAAVYSNQGYMLPKMNNEYYPDDLEKLPVLHAKNKKGENAIFFYSSGSVEWKYDKETSKYVHTLNLYTDSTYFFISSDVAKSNTPDVKTIDGGTADINFDNYDQHLLYEEENINVLNSGRKWYSAEITKNFPSSFTIETENVIEAKNAIMTIEGGGGSSSDSRFTIQVNDKLIGQLEFGGCNSTQKARRNKNDYSIQPSSSMKVSLTYTNDSGDGTSWLDYITITLNARLNKTNQPLVFRNHEALDHAMVKYTVQGSMNSPVLWDVSDPVKPLNINFTKNSGSITFTDAGQKISNYVLFDPTNDDFLGPDFRQDVPNQNIHGLPMYDFIIVTHPKFLSASETLAEYHREQDNMDVLIVTTDEVYNEFSSGMRDVAAIRNMARMFYKRKTATDSLRYILLMGDGSFNNRSTEDIIPNYIPTYQSELSDAQGSFVSDDFFVLLDDDEGEAYGQIDIGIGRIPCRTLDEANVVVTKTMKYTEPETMGDWRNVITFIADDEDGNLHMRDTEKLVSIINSNYDGFYDNKIYFDSYKQIETAAGKRYPEASAAIKQTVEDGSLIVNYVGHANERGLAHENVLLISDINSWSNQNKLPVFVTATCEFSEFDNTETSAGEDVLLNPAGGGVALFSTSRVVYSDKNYNLSANFYRSVFQHDNKGEKFRMGDIMRRAKNLTSLDSYKNKRNFVLLGDPALKLAFPKEKVVTTKINGIDASDSTAVGALDKVSVEGKVTDPQGNLLSNYNGTVSTVVYDKEVQVTTLANDSDPAFQYKVQNNSIYKGTASVTNGKFQFSFVIPKDITYNVGNGKIIYYVNNGTDDGNGSTNAFKIGGSSSNPVVDNDAPKVEMFLNDESFRQNDKVSSSAILLVNLFDESGINTVGTGIGHDIVAILDDDYSKPMILNDFYKATLDSYQQGKITFPINNLDPGEHKISLKVWDVQNNSTVEELKFIVEEGFQITAVTNYPNPVSFNTTFEITHNLPGDVFDTKLEIFNLSGFKIWETNETTGSYSSVNATIRWDVTNTNYPLNRDKILVYRITMVNQEGLRATGAGKLMLKLN